MTAIVAWVIGISCAALFFGWLWKARRDEKRKRQIAAGIAGGIVADAARPLIGDAAGDSGWGDWGGDGGGDGE